MPDWQVAERKDTPITKGINLPNLCAIEVVTVTDGRRMGAWDEDCWLTLEAYEAVSEGNLTIANSNAAALGETEEAYDVLTQAGQMQADLTQFFADLYDEERRSHFLDNMIYRILILLGIGVAL